MQEPPVSDSLVEVSETELSSLLSIAFAGSKTEAERFVRGLLRSANRATSAHLARIAISALRSSDRSSGPFRSETLAAIPVDLESRATLLRTEFPVVLENEPIWANDLGRQLRRIIDERSRTAELHEAGLSAARSLIFVGPPGSGKTLAARWLARELGLPLFTLDLASVISSLLGRTGSNIRNVLDFAKGVHCVLFLDELDAIAKRRDDDIEIGELKRLVTVLLQEIDSWPERSILVGATNHPEIIDRALWRRFDLYAEFGQPTTLQAQVAILQALNGAEVDPQLVEVASEVMSTSSFSDINRDILRVRRTSIIDRISVSDALKDLIKSKIQSIERSERHKIARRLIANHNSQREISDLIGVSRDTLRKFARAGESLIG